MTDTSDKDASIETVSAQVRGETMAHALQSGMFNLAANFYESGINVRVQKYYHDKYGHDASKWQRYGTFKQNIMGEFAGDLSGMGTLMGLETFVPEQLHTFTRGARRFIDPLFEGVAQRVFAKYEGTPDYRPQIDKWKLFHERNFVRSGIVLAGGLTGNLLTQKLIMENPSPTKVIFMGKMLSSTVTMGLNLAIRFCYADEMKKLDSWMAEKYFSQNMEDRPLNGNGNGNGGHASKVLKGRQTVTLEPAR